MSKKSLLELFSGTHSVGKVLKDKYDIISLDRDLGDPDNISNTHIQEDIMTWDYKIYPRGMFDVIWASPVCLWWSNLRCSWIGRKLKGMDRPFTKQDIQDDIDKYGKPMVDKVREIIDYFEPKHYIIENPKTGKIKTYITDLPYYDVDYCKYCDWGYKKSTRFWTNIEGFQPKVCKNDCENIVVVGEDKKQYKHKINLASSEMVMDNGKLVRVNSKELRQKYRHVKQVNDFGGGTNRLQRYRIPPKLIEDLFNVI